MYPATRLCDQRVESRPSRLVRKLAIEIQSRQVCLEFCEASSKYGVPGPTPGRSHKRLPQAMDSISLIAGHQRRSPAAGSHPNHRLRAYRRNPGRGNSGRSITKNILAGPDLCTSSCRARVPACVRGLVSIKRTRVLGSSQHDLSFPRRSAPAKRHQSPTTGRWRAAFSFIRDEPIVGVPFESRHVPIEGRDSRVIYHHPAYTDRTAIRRRRRPQAVAPFAKEDRVCLRDEVLILIGCPSSAGSS